MAKRPSFSADLKTSVVLEIVSGERSRTENGESGSTEHK